MAPRAADVRSTDPSTPDFAAPEETQLGSERLVYLYAVIDAESPAGELLRAGRVSGLIAGEPLFPIEQDGLIAAASFVPAHQFSSEAIDELASDLESLAPFALRHEEAVRALLPATRALVPLAFGAVYRTPERVAAFLKERAADLRAALDRVRDRDEWGIKVFRDTPRFTQVVLAPSESLHQAELRAASPGRAYLLRKSRERRVEGEVEAETDRSTARIAAQLAEAAALARREAIPIEAAATSRALVLKAAFLVDRASAETFAARCDEIARIEAARGLQLEITGPWAPYSFVAEAR